MVWGRAPKACGHRQAQGGQGSRGFSPSTPTYQCSCDQMHPVGSQACSHSGRNPGGCCIAGNHHTDAPLSHTRSHLGERERGEHGSAPSTAHPWSRPPQAPPICGPAHQRLVLTHTCVPILVDMVPTRAEQRVLLARVGAHCIHTAGARPAGLCQRCALIDVCRGVKGHEREWAQCPQIPFSGCRVILAGHQACSGLWGRLVPSPKGHSHSHSHCLAPVSFTDTNSRAQLSWGEGWVQVYALNPNASLHMASVPSLATVLFTYLLISIITVNSLTSSNPSRSPPDHSR